MWFHPKIFIGRHTWLLITTAMSCYSPTVHHLSAMPMPLPRQVLAAPGAIPISIVQEGSLLSRYRRNPFSAAKFNLPSISQSSCEGRPSSVLHLDNDSSSTWKRVRQTGTGLKD